jgi:nucleoside-diphosphate-sugar epimerase
MNGSENGSILLTGVSGNLGGLVAAALLSGGCRRIVAPIRNGHTRESVLKKLTLELNAERRTDDIDFDRLITVDLPRNDDIHNLYPALCKLAVNEVIHCAGSVEYYDLESLKEGNIDLTTELIRLGQRLHVRRFVYLSTAFSSGFTNKLVCETLHPSPESDPTEYTRSKREAEALVSSSSLPFLIIRPSVVVGDSRSGRYSGRPYGLYQLWSAFEKFLSDRYRPVMHLIAPAVKLPIIHQDAFTTAFLAAYHYLPDDSIIHLVSRHETLPTVRDITSCWLEGWSRPCEVHYYDRLSEVPLQELDRRMRMWLEFTSVNMDIAGHHWRFQTTALDNLRATGLELRDATLDTVRICQERFIAQSPRINAFLAKTAEPFAALGS